MNDNTSYKILLVEDNLIDMRLLKILLLNIANFAFELTCVKTLNEAIAHLKRDRFDGILLDLFLPDCRGLETLTRLKQESLASRSSAAENVGWQTLPPIVVLTGLEDEDIALKAIQTGAQDYLLKGELSSRLLIRTLHYSIERSKIEELLRQASEELDAQLSQRTANLRRTLGELEKEITRRRQAEAQLRQDRENLEELVRERTAELEARNAQLRQEIDRRQQSEAALRESEERYRAVIEGSKEIIFQTDREGNWCFLSPAWQDILGYERSDSLGKSFVSFIHSDDRPAAIEKIEKLLDGRMAASHCEMKWMHADGSIRWLEAFGNPYITPAGNREGIAGIFRDVTDRKQSEEQLKLYREIVANANDAIAIIDPDGYYLEQNRTHANLIGYSDGELERETPTIHLGNETFGAIAAELATTGVYRGEVVSRTKTGDAIDLDLSAFTIRDERGQPTCYVGVKRDISDRKRIEGELRFSQFAVENAAETIVWLNDVGQFVRVNRAACEMSGYSRQEWLNLEIFALNPNFTPEGWLAFWQQLEGEGSRVLESLLQDRKGNFIPVEVLATFLEFDGRKYICAFVRDIRDRISAQMALQESEERFRHTFEQAAVGIAQVCPNGKFSRVNQKLCQILGYTAEELMQLNFRDITHPEEYDISVERIDQLLRRERETYSLEKRYLRKDGTPIWTNLTVSLIWTPENTPKHFVSIFQDISDRKAAEAELQQTTLAKQQVQAELDRIMASLEDLVWSVDATQWKLTYLNPAVEKIFGRKGEEFLADASLWLEVVHPDDRDRAAAETQMLLVAGERRFEYRILRPDGTTRWISYHARVTYDETGNPLQIDGITSDITRRKEVEEALERERALLRCLIDSIPDFIFYKNREGAYLGCNATFARFLERSEAEIVDRTDFDLFESRELALKVRERDLAVLAAGCPQTNEEWAIYPDGNRRRLDTLKTPFIGADGEVLGIIGITRDITDRKQAELELRRSEAKQRALIEAIPDLLIRMRADGTYLEMVCGGRVEEVFRPDMRGGAANIYNTMPQDKAEERMRHIARALATGESQTYEYQLVLAEKTLEEEARIVPYDDDEVLVMIRDIGDRKRAEAGLRQSEAKQRALLQAIPDLLIRMNDEGIQLDVMSSGHIELFARASEAIGSHIDQILPLDRAEERMEYVRRVLAAQAPESYEYQLIKGDKIWEEEARIVPFGEREVLVMIRDISDRKRAEMERDRFFTQSLDLLCIAGVDGYFRRVNPAWEVTLGFRSGEMLARPFIDFVHPDDREATIAATAQMARGNSIVNFENRYQCKDGSYKWLTWNATAFLQESLIYAVARDVTAQKNYEANLERERRQLQQIVKNAPVAMAMFDRQMNFLAHSDRWLTDYELPQMPLVGWNYYDIFADIPDRWREAHQRTLQGEKLAQPEDIFEREDGQAFYLRWASHPWHEADGTIGGIVIVTDRIDELVRGREAALENARLKSQFLANMSHEIRTPMNGVLGMTELLLNTSLNRQQLDFVQTLRSSGENLLAIINDILDFSKLEVGEMRLDACGFDLNRAIEELLDLFAPQSRNKGLELACVIEQGVPSHLKGDVLRLRQILTNLLGNALKFTDSGEITLTITNINPPPNPLPRGGEQDRFPLAPLTKGGKEGGIANNQQPITNQLHFAIEDTGIGISAEGQKKLFQSFSQVDASNTRKYGGTGLGLAICKELVQLMDGEIGVESIPDRGSKFWFTAVFEALTPEEQAEIPLPASVALCPSALAGKKLLVIDDNATNRKVACLQAKAWGMEVDEAQSGTVALAILRLAAVLKKSYDFALIDMQMPEMTGDELGRQIRSEPELDRTRLIMMTSLDDVDLMSRWREIGFSGYFLKPIVASRLLRCLLEVTEQSPARVISEDAAVLSPEAAEIAPALITGKILVVEDALVNQKVVLNQLRLLGYEANFAHNGREALASWETGNYDLIFMDCQMPVMDGYQAVQSLRQREGEERHTIVVGLTAYALKGDREKCLDAGMDDYLAKPVSKNDLAAMLEKWLPLSVTSHQSPVTSHPQQPTTNNQLINLEQLDAITDGDLEFQAELLQSFLEDARVDVLQAKQALQDKKPDVLGQKVHRIKGAAANLAITELAHISAVLETQARENQFENPDRLLAKMEELIEEVHQFLETMLVSHQSPVTSHQLPVTSHQLPVTSPTTNNPLINREFLQSLSGGDREFEVELLHSFLNDIETELQQAKVALESERYTELVQRGNSFKGAAESLGVGAIPNLSERLLEEVSHRDREAISIVLAEIERILEQIQIELEN
ncbi:MAG: PAS domain S-box protein [Cyanobacteria bacterium P01_E01_bin.42]